jgi:hypothetical protein
MSRLEEPLLILSLPETAIALFEEGEPVRPEFLDTLRQDLRQFGNADNIEFVDTSVGRGAAGYALLFGLAALFLSGKTINENLDAWIAIARRVQDLVRRLQRKHGLYVSESVGFALAVAHVDELYNTRVTQLVASIRLPIKGGVSSADLEKSFHANPDRFYVFVLEDSRRHTYVVTLTSQGSIVMTQHLDTIDWYRFVRGADDDEEPSPEES